MMLHQALHLPPTWGQVEFDNIAHVLLSLVIYDEATGSSLSKAPSLGISRLERPHAYAGGDLFRKWLRARRLRVPEKFHTMVM